MKRPSLLHRIKALSNHEKFVWLLLTSTVILMIFFMICRFCGLSYFTNKYEEQSAETWMKELILFISSLFDYILIAMCLSRAKWYWCTLTGLLFNCLFFIPMPTWLPIVLDFGYMFYRMSNTEIEHYNMLHDAVVKQISKYKMEQGTPPIAMQTIYDWEHEKAIHELLDIKKKLDMFKSSM